MNFERTLALLHKAIDTEIYPCAAMAIGKRDQIFCRESVGFRAIYPERKPVTEHTLFDMASLTKIIATSMVALRAIEEGIITLSDPISMYFDNCCDKGSINILQLMTHQSGIPGHIMLRDQSIRPEETIDLILRTPFEYPTGTKVVYSCMGYMVLGAILEKMLGAPLDILAQKMVFDPLGMKTACFNPTTDDVVSTEYDEYEGKYICGKVHDENARFLGGVSANAGLFCSLDDVIAYTRMLSKHGEGFLSHRMFEAAIRDYTPNFTESRGLGLQLYTGKPCPSGDLFSLGSYGHTGFVGNSIYVDRETGIFIILLSNRVHFGRDYPKAPNFRKLFENTAWLELQEMGLA